MNNYLFNYFAIKAKKYLLNQKITDLYASFSDTLVINTQCDLAILFKLSPQSTFFVSDYKLPKITSQFARSLQKKINGLRVSNIFFQGLERVLTIELLDKREFIEHKFYLVFEITSRIGNIILLDNDQRIIESYKYLPNREILPHKPYKKPSKMLDLYIDELEKIKNLLYKENILGIDNFIKKFLTKENLESFIDAISAPSNNIYRYRLGSKYYYYPFFFDFGLPFDIISEKELIDALLNASQSRSSQSNEVIKVIDKKLKTLELRVSKIQADQYKANDSNTMKLYADALLLNIATIKKGQSIVRLRIDNEYTDIGLNPEKTIQQNIDYYYKLYKKYKNAVNVFKKRLDQTYNEIDKLKNLKENLSKLRIDPIDAKNLLLINNPIKHKSLEILSYERLNILGFDVYLGKNAKGNDLILKNASKDDIWMHTKNIPGPHLIIKNPRRFEDINKAILLECAKKIKEKIKIDTKIEVDYTFVKFVKKPKGFKKGRVTYTNFKTVMVG